MSRFAPLLWGLPLVAIHSACHQTNKPGPLAIDRLSPCKMDQGPTDAYCGKLSVFENRKTKQGRKIDLKIIILPALRRDPKPDPVFFFAGGPGQGAAKMAETIGEMFKRFQNDRDLVMIDQRGTGDSNPLHCEMEEKGQEKDDLRDVPQEAIMDRYRKCLAGYEGKADPAQYTTSIAMDDIDEVRDYLGYERINLWGASYGTRAALVYLRQHEAKVRSVILDGVAPPSMKLPLFAARDSQRALGLLLDDCEKDKACSAKFPGLREAVRKVLARADGSGGRVRLTHPRTGEKFETPLSADVIRGAVFWSLYSPSTASLLPRLLKDASQGDFQGLLTLGHMGEGSGIEENMSLGMFLSVTCSEDMPRIAAADIARETANTFFGETMFKTRMKACEFWPKGELPAGYHQPVQSHKPVLVLSGDVDPVTPPVWGEEVHRHLPNSKHIVVPGAGHGVSSLGCIPKLLSRFLEEASVANIDGSCAANHKRPPFFVHYSGPEVAAAK